jgi:hypothetical protein
VVVAAGSFVCEQAPKPNALAAMATIITALKIFTLYFRLLSQQVAAVI